MLRMFLGSPKKMSKSASIERGRYYARVFTRVLEWKGQKLSIFMACGVIELLRMCLKEFRSTIRKRTTSRQACSDSSHLGRAGCRNKKSRSRLKSRR
jgi:hypothetical protein